MSREEKEFRSGFVAIIGRPNVGKSTLLNRILGEKVAIISEKPQTTRTCIRGILTGEQYQIVFLDTPGIHKARRDAINRFMVQTALATLSEADVVLFLLDPPTLGRKGSRFIAARLQEREAPVIAAVNKIDTLPASEIPSYVSLCRSLGEWQAVLPISAKTGQGIPELLERIVGSLPPGPLYFPAEHYTDQPTRFMVAEIIREKIFCLTAEEIPYAAAVVVESYQVGAGAEADPEQRRVSIEAVIYVERQSQKGILIGKGGEMLKAIGSRARQEIEALLGAKVVLRLWVKVARGWTDDTAKMRALGYG